MHLDAVESSRFYRLLNELHLVALRHLGLDDGVEDVDDVELVPPDDRAKASDAIFDSTTGILDRFLAENPAHLSEADLEQVGEWRHAQQGEFFLERILKKGAIFIEDGDAARVFQVIGIRRSFDDLVPTYALPLLVKMTLLPFQGRVLYDGVTQTYAIHFGGGIRSRLRETYLTAKQNDRIITDLMAGIQVPKPSTPPPSAAAPWSADIQAVVATLDGLRGGKAPVHAPALKLVRASALVANVAASDPDDVGAMWDAMRKVLSAYKGMHRVLSRLDGQQRG